MIMIKENYLLKICCIYSVLFIICNMCNLESLQHLTSFLLWVPLLGFLNLVCYAPFVGKLLFRKSQFLHRGVTSDIPGNPHAFDNCVISLMQTLPEPSNFNICFTGMKLGKKLRIEGTLPPATINSISLYSRTTPDPPVTLDLSTVKLDCDGRFKVLLVPQLVADATEQSIKKGESAILAYPNHWEGGFIAMRNFSVNNGCRVITPTVYAEDGAILRAPTSLVAGITATMNSGTEKAMRILVLNLMFFSQCDWTLFQRAILLGGLLAGYLFYNALFFIGKRGLNRDVCKFCPHLHEFRCPDLVEASKVSQPSREHRYWIMRYDMNRLSGSDIIIDIPMKFCGQKYWSLTVYDDYGLPIPQFVNIHNTSYTPTDKNEYNINVRLTLAPKDVANDVAAVSTAYAAVDVSQAPTGYAIFRIVHPTLPSTEAYSIPVASLSNSL